MRNQSSMHFLMNGHITLHYCLNRIMVVLTQGYSMRKGAQSDYIAVLCILHNEHEAILKGNLDNSQLKKVYVIIDH